MTPAKMGMPAMFDSPGIAPLDRLECLRLLATQAVGRVVFTSHALPAIQPVRFRLHRGAVYFMVGSHGPLAASH
ncbi:MAG: pyridoxamine 5'-phosphate oxidase family protein, partial [Sciscionella sp.]